MMGRDKKQKKGFKPLRLYITLLAFIIFAVACLPRSTPQETTSRPTHYSKKTSGYSNSREIENRLRHEYKAWQGTRHRLGGTGRKGIDCSGFVKTVYKERFNIELPRTTKRLLKTGKRVKRKSLQAGDLVFFRPPTYPYHVGIFLGGKDFMHASTKKGVVISQIVPPYWDKHYFTARRILPKK